jgi:hypothetical protein
MIETMRSQVVPQLQALPKGNDLIRQYDAIVSDISTGKPVEIDASLPQGLRNLFASLTNPTNSPFAQELLTVNAADLLTDVREPILIIIGKKDMQVDWQADGRALELALAGHENVTFVYPDNANHILKYEPQARERLVPTEVAANYNAADRRLDADALAAIRKWLTVQAGIDSAENSKE